ncbi:uncharacterized protein [Diabrotica undecimpunctata]|uniref:uncharacterized protein isoform X2 n=1 Tax=Diabrotica undecimpunctata TaxID=50387 RepID=UPI003B63A73A
MHFPSELLVIVNLISPILSDCLQRTAYGNWSVTISTYRAYGIGDKYKALFNLTGYYINETYDIIHLWNTDVIVFCYDSAAIESVLNTDKSVHYVTFWIHGWSITLQRREEKMWSSWKTNQDYVFLNNGTKCKQSMPFSKLASLIIPDLPDASPRCDGNPENFELSNTKRYNDSVAYESPIISEPTVFAIIAMVFCSIGLLIIIFCICRRFISTSFCLRCCKKAEHKPESTRSSFAKPVVNNDLMGTLCIKPLEIHKYYEVGNTQAKYYDLQGNRIPVQINQQNQIAPQYDYPYSHVIRPNRQENNNI